MTARAVLLFVTVRNDIETIGVRAGCSLTAFEDSDFNGDQVVIRAGSVDRWGEEEKMEGRGQCAGGWCWPRPRATSIWTSR